MIRDVALSMTLSVLFELMEYTFVYLQPNFNECWCGRGRGRGGSGAGESAPSHALARRGPTRSPSPRSVRGVCPGRWDHWILDFLLCNTAGIVMGHVVLRWAGRRGASARPKVRARGHTPSPAPPLPSPPPTRVSYLDSREYNWRGIADVPTVPGKIMRVLRQVGGGGPAGGKGAPAGPGG